MTTKLVRGEELAAYMNVILERSIKPHAEAIARAADEQEVAVVFHDVDAAKPHVRQFVEALRRSEMGPVVRLSRSRARELFASLEHSDPAFFRWATSKRDHVRVLVVAHEGSTLAINCDDGGWGFERGTLDPERWS